MTRITHTHYTFDIIFLRTNVDTNFEITHLYMKDGVSTFSHMHLPFTNRRIQFLCQKSPDEGRKSA